MGILERRRCRRGSGRLHGLGDITDVLRAETACIGGVCIHSLIAARVSLPVMIEGTALAAGRRVAGLFQKDMVKLRFCLGHIGTRKHDMQNTECNDAQQEPAYKGQMQQEGVHFLPFHHGTGLFFRVVPADFRIVSKDIGYHQIFIIFDNARNDQKQAPQPDKKIF